MRQNKYGAAIKLAPIISLLLVMVMIEGKKDLAYLAPPRPLSLCGREHELDDLIADGVRYHENAYIHKRQL